MLFSFFGVPSMYLTFPCAKTPVKKTEKLSCQMSDFSKLLLLWMSQKSIPPSAHLTWSIKNYNWNWLHQNTCVIQHDLPFSSLGISKSLILSPDLPAAPVTPFLTDTWLPSHLLSTWVRLATHPNSRKLHRCLISLPCGRCIKIFAR